MGASMYLELAIGIMLLVYLVIWMSLLFNYIYISLTANSLQLYYGKFAEYRRRRKKQLIIYGTVLFSLLGAYGLFYIFTR